MGWGEGWIEGLLSFSGGDGLDGFGGPGSIGNGRGVKGFAAVMKI